jgi:SAM-dependent methyltransferase
MLASFERCSLKKECRLTESAGSLLHTGSFADEILRELGRQMPFLHNATASGVPSLEIRMPELNSIAARLSSIYGDPSHWIPETVRGYVMLSMEFLKLQRELEKTGRYLLGSEREALQVAYANQDVFGAYYLPGLLLSEALWPNHFLLGEAFKKSFLNRLASGSEVLEVGVGTGYHLELLFRYCPDVSYTGFDISTYAIDFCRHYAFGKVGEDPRARFIEGNVSHGLRLPPSSVDAVVMGEILEHIEDPAVVLRNVRNVLRPGGCMFLTTVVFAANIDHIFMFETVGDIRGLLLDNGWRIVRDWPLPVYPKDTPEMARRPMNYGALVVPVT